MTGIDAVAPPPAVRHLLEEIEPPAPFWRLREAFADAAHPFLLDSALADGRLGRCSFAGGDPDFAAVVRRGPAPPRGGPRPARFSLVRRRAADGSSLPERVAIDGDFHAILRALLRAWRVPASAWAARPLPLLAGAVTALGAGAAHFGEDLPESPPDPFDLPDAVLLGCDELVGHRHADGRTWLSVVGRGDDTAAALRHAEMRLERLRARVAAFRPAPPRPDAPIGDPAAAAPAVADLPDADYLEAVAAIRRDILAGRIFEACLTRRLETRLRADPWRLYALLRAANPAPFSACIDLPGAVLVSSSPERFLSLDPDGRVESRPIKGTRPRGADAAADGRLRAELAASEKDRAENTMIVDLARNDLGRVCRFGSVRAPELHAVEAYATVFQMVSTVTGELAPGRDGVDLLRAAFPGGSMTGAPKIEALKVIAEQERSARGFYAGALGWLDFSGPLDLSIVIRTAVCRDGRCLIGTGGAITADSDPEAELREAEDKAAALLAAVARADATA